MSAYANISSFGSNAQSAVNDPITYCMTNNLDSRFMHGGQSDTLGTYSKSCQAYMGQYCAKGWDDFCEIASNNQNTYWPNNAQPCNQPSDTACKGLTSGEYLVHNTAMEKYLVKMGNCVAKFEPFDPTVASSPMVKYYRNDGCSYSGRCVPEYGVDAKEIDKDPVMDKILARPVIAFDILVNIYNSMKRKGNLGGLKNTKLGRYYSINPYFKNLGGI